MKPQRPVVGMIGRGNVGKALSQGLARAGYEVESAGKEPPRVRAIAERADVLVLAVPYAERANALREIGDAARGKVLVDVSNALGERRPEPPDFRATSGAEELQRMAPPGARVVKAFNTVFAQSMGTGQVRGEPLAALVAADDAEAKRLVLDMARGIGFDAIDAGPLRNARWLEALGLLNISLGYEVGHGSGIGFRVVRAAEQAGRIPAPPPAGP